MQQLTCRTTQTRKVSGVLFCNNNLGSNEQGITNPWYYRLHVDALAAATILVSFGWYSSCRVNNFSVPHFLEFPGPSGVAGASSRKDSEQVPGWHLELEDSVLWGDIEQSR